MAKYVPIGNALTKPIQIFFRPEWIGGKGKPETITIGTREYEKPLMVKSGRIRKQVPGKVTKSRMATQDEMKYLREERGMTSIIGDSADVATKVHDAFDPNKEVKEVVTPAATPRKNTSTNN